jgi:hypothetical protein
VTVSKVLPYGMFGVGLDKAASSPNSRAMVAAAEELLRDSLLLFPNDAFMRLQAAHYMRAIGGNVFLERMFLRMAASLADTSTVDVLFYAEARLRQLHDEDIKIARGRMTVETRLYFDAMQAFAEQRVSYCRSLLLSFWSQLCDRTPDLQSLQRKGRQIFETCRATEAVFKELLAIVPTSVPVMRLYAEYLIDVANNAKLAEELMHDADQAEDELSKASTVRHSASDFAFGSIVTFDLGSDGVGLVRVSARDDNEAESRGSRGAGGPGGGGAGPTDMSVTTIGSITSANANALKLLGYTSVKREVLGREMSLLIPHPIASIHPRYLSGFMADGKQRTTGANRMLYVTHRSGFIVPVKAHVQTTREEFLVAFEEIQAQQLSFLWCYGAENGWKIQAADRRAATAFGLPLVGLRAGNVSATFATFVDDPAATVRKVRANPGCVIQLHNLAKGLSASSSFLAVQGSMKKSSLFGESSADTAARVKNSTSAFYTAHVQEVAIPLVDQPVFMWVLAFATPAEVQAAVQVGMLMSSFATEGVIRKAAKAKKKGARWSKSKMGAGGGSGGDDSSSSSGDEDGRDADATHFDGSLEGSVDSNDAQDSADESKQSSADASDDDDEHQKREKELAAVKAKKDAQRVADLRARAKSTLLPGMGSSSEERSTSHSGVAATNGSDPSALQSAPHPALQSAIHHGPHAGAQKRGVAFADSGDDSAPDKDDTKVAVGPAVGTLTVQPHAPHHDGPHHKHVEAGAPPLLAQHGGPLKPAKLGGSIARGGGSVASGGSGKSGGSDNSHLSPSEMLRRGVRVRSQHTETSLSRLRFSLIVVFGIVLVTNIISFVVTQSLTGQLLLNLESMGYNSQRAVHAQLSADFVQRLTAFNDLSMGSPKYDLKEGVGYARENIRVSIATMESLHKSLYAEAQKNGGEWLASYVEPRWRVVDLVAGTYIDRDHYAVTSRNVSLADIVFEYASRLRALWFYESVKFTADDANVFWVENNVPVSVAASLNTSLYFSSSTSENLTSQVNVANQIVLGVALVVFFLITVVVIVPSVLDVVREQRSVFDTLGRIPVKVMRHMRDTLAERISQLQREARGEEDGAFGSEENKEESDEVAAAAAANRELELASSPTGQSTRLRGAALAANLMQQSKAAKAAAAEEAKTRARPLSRCEALLCCGFCRKAGIGSNGAVPASRWSFIATASSRQLNTMGSEPPRKFSNASRVFVGLLARFIWPVLAFCTFYIGMYFVRSDTAVQAGFSRSAVLWTVELELLVSTIGFDVRAIMWYTEPSFMYAYTVKSDNDISMTMSVVKDVVFGSTTRHLQSLIVTSPATQRLMTINGCVENAVSAEECALYGGPNSYYGCNEYYRGALCKFPDGNTNISTAVFDNGIIGRGLYPALLELELLVLDVVRDAYASSANDVFESCDHVAGTRGDTINQLASNYLAAGLAALSAGVQAEAINSIVTSNNNDVLAVVLSSLAIFVIFFLVYRPLIARLDLEMKQNRTLLLLVPDEVAKAVPAVVMAAQKLAQFAQQQ